ncbi:MAG: nucleoside triphosphate pyrophosphohydrolase [Verrucomicrobiota bacterium]
MSDSITELREIVARLRAPGGCPWDREQTHASLKSDLIEEAYEVMEAIDRKDDAHLAEELGDFLLQVVMHCQIASEEKRFDFDEVARLVGEKLIRRHPHVFGDVKADDSETVLKNWDQIKREEKGGTESILDHVSAALPALMRAGKVQKRAARVGFDWADVHGVVEKIHEELAEVEAAMQGSDRDHLEQEIGDLLFTVVNLSRKAKFDAELVLQQATNKFINRFQALEGLLKKRGMTFDQCNLTELDLIWDEVKAGE